MRDMLNDADHKTMCQRIGPVLKELKTLVSGTHHSHLTSLSNLKELEPSIEQRGRLLFHSVRAQLCRLFGDKHNLNIEKGCVSDILKQSIIVRGRTLDGMSIRRVVDRNSLEFEVCRGRSSFGSLINANVVDR